MKRVLAVGGSDSSGGAGIQADVKTLHALGVHASTVVTAVTAQSSTDVLDVHDVPVDSIRAQLSAVLGDLGADVVKTGMLSSAGAVLALAEALQGQPLVIDPVGVSSTGRSLLTPAALGLLRTRLLPLTTVVTPNLAEVAALTGLVVEDEAGLQEAAEAVHALGPRWVLVKGGHLPGQPTDLLYDGKAALLLRGDRIPTRHTHGTGCTLASALAAHLALGDDVPTAARKAKEFVADALRRGYPLGAGPGPVRP
ncbi:MAG: hydroxymethylpyrimidine/phosphomethylpyrimidine kinase [Frankiales bacterium]|nr:hydroxymethylpyrimidine/phosphomethylpyrimidine kinase [Frankiales bacterium]